MILKIKTYKQNALCKSLGTAIDNSRQKLDSRRGGHGSLQHEKERRDRWEMWKKDKGGSGKPASGAGRYNSRKRRVGRAPCPKRPGQTRKGRAWPESRKGRAFHQDGDLSKERKKKKQPKTLFSSRSNITHQKHYNTTHT